MTINTLTLLPSAPSRTSSPATFNSEAEAFVAAMEDFVPELNTAIGQMNADFASANYSGDWSSDTGSASAGDVYSHNGALWILLSSTGDITGTEPSASNTDWLLIGGSPIGEAVLQTLSGTTPTWTLSSGAAATLTLSGNTTITLSGFPSGSVAFFAFLRVIQDAGASGYTLGFSGATVKTEAGSGLPTMSATASAIDDYVLYSIDNGTTVVIRRVSRDVQ